MLDYISTNLLILMFVWAGLFFFLKILFSRCVQGWSDPLNIALIFIAFSTAGFMFLPFVQKVGNSFWIILIAIFIYLIACSIPKLPKDVKFKTLAISSDIQIYFSLVLLALMIIVLLNDFLSGNIAIFREGGISTRFVGASDSNRFLVWINYSIANLPIIFFSLTNNKTVKKISLITMSIIFVKSILFASKSSLFFIPLMMIVYHYLIGIKEQGIKERQNTKRYKRKIEIIIAALLFVLIIFFPIFAILIQGAQNYSEGLNLIFFRLFAGYDNLIYVSIKDIPMENIMSRYGFYSIVLLYASSIFKVLLGFKPEFNSVSEIILNEVFGVEGSILRQIPLPNSNLILESIWTNGLIFGLPTIFIIGLVSFSFRKKILLSTHLKLIDVIFFNAIVLSPMLWFVSGMEFINYLMTNLILYFMFSLIINLRQENFLKNLKFKLI